jgi:serine protease Do
MMVMVPPEAPLLQRVWQTAVFSCFLLFFCGGLFCGDTVQAQAPSRGLSEQDRQRLYQELSVETSAIQRQAGVLRKVIKLVRPAVVHIEVDPGGRKNRHLDETGSGVIIKEGNDYYILTNRHLVHYADPNEIIIRLSDGREIQPDKVWTDAGTDVAVMHVKSKRLVAARIGDSDKTEIGDYIIAIGSPFGLNHSVTHGIVSAKGRRDLELATDGVEYQDFLQIDASINPGNSGGPLVNLRGEVVGINTAIASTSGRNEGIGFTIPINMVMAIARQLIAHGTVERGFLGVSLDSRFGAAAAAELGLDSPQGARVKAVTFDSAAEKAELRVGDVILRFDQTWIESDLHLINQVSLTQVGNPVPLLVYRNRKTVQLMVTVGKRP